MYPICVIFCVNLCFRFVLYFVPYSLSYLCIIFCHISFHILCNICVIFFVIFFLPIIVIFVPYQCPIFVTFGVILCHPALGKRDSSLFPPSGLHFSSNLLHRPHVTHIRGSSLYKAMLRLLLSTKSRIFCPLVGFKQQFSM